MSHIESLAITPVVREQTQALIGESLRAHQPFAFSRWGDGEFSAVTGRGHANCDGQEYQPLREDLRRILCDRPPYWLGLQPLAVRRFEPEITRWLQAHDLWPTWLNADIWHTLSIKGQFLDFLTPLRTRQILLVGPARLQRLGSVLPFHAFVEIPPTNAYASLGDIRIRLAQALTACGPQTVVAICAGMVANILIHDYAATAPREQAPADTTWIDFGSAWEPYIGHVNRSYHAAIVARERIG